METDLLIILYRCFSFLDSRTDSYIHDKDDNIRIWSQSWKRLEPTGDKKLGYSPTKSTSGFAGLFIYCTLEIFSSSPSSSGRSGMEWSVVAVLAIQLKGSGFNSDPKPDPDPTLTLVLWPWASYLPLNCPALLITCFVNDLTRHLLTYLLT